MAIGGEVAAGARRRQHADTDNRGANPPAAIPLSAYVTWALLVVVVVLLGLMILLMKVPHETDGTSGTSHGNYTKEILEAVEKWMKNHRPWMDKEETEFCHKSAENTLPVSLVDNITTAVTKNVEQLLNKHYSTQSHSKTTFDSCVNVQEQFPASASAYYDIEVKNGRPLHTYCDMTLTCGGITGGWRRVAYLNMSEAGTGCPPGFIQGKPTSCKRSEEAGGCSSIIYQNYGLSHTAVCGRIHGFHIRTLDGFNRPFNPTLDNNYVDGVSLTHYNHKVRTHIWTLAASICDHSKTNVPGFVGYHYSFDHGRSLTELLWDDVQCPGTPSSNSAWFFRELEQESHDNIEIRLCRDQARDDEDILLTNVEIYVK